MALIPFLTAMAGGAATMAKAAQDLNKKKQPTTPTSTTPSKQTTPVQQPSSGVYNSNTNIANEKAYLNSLISKGGGNAQWAKNQLNELNKFSLQSTAQVNQPVVNNTAQAQGGGRDIAAELVGMLTQGGAIDYGKLNNLVTERDTKINSNPDLYGQFESTQSLLNKYLPTAQMNEQLLAQNQALIDAQKQQLQQPQNDVDSVISLLTGLANEQTKGMSFSEAQRRAQGELNPMYLSASNLLAQNLNMDMEQRGIYNSPLASGIMTEKQGQLSNEQISAVAERANQLIQNDQEMSLQEKQLRSNTLSSLLNSLIGREANMADITGYYNGTPTLANQKYQTDKSFGEAELTGNYNGQQTLSSKAFDLQTQTSRLTNALNQVNAMGSVTTEEQARLLGVPVGTPSWQAKEAAASREQELQMFNREMSYKNQSLTLQRSAQGAQDLLDNFNKDMIIWGQTGKSPDTEAMRHYGIAPGTPWSADAKLTAQQKLEEANAQLELIFAEEELGFQNRATNFMGTYNVPRNIAESALVIIDQAPDLNTATKIAKANRTALQQEGINIATLEGVLQKYYGFYETVKPITPTTTDTNVPFPGVTEGSFLEWINSKYR